MLAILIIQIVISSVLENGKISCIGAFAGLRQNMNDESTEKQRDREIYGMEIVEANSYEEKKLGRNILHQLIYYVREIHMFGSVLVKSIKH